MLKQFKAYYFPAISIFSILLGGCVGYLMGPHAAIFKPLGDIFINLIFTMVVPLVFFSVASSVSRIGTSKKLLNIISTMFATFIFTGIVAAIFMIVIVMIFPPAQGVFLTLPQPEKITAINMADQVVSIFTVSDFSKLFTHENMLALIFFSTLVGIATAATKEKGELFSRFLQAGAEIFMKIVTLIMYFAPIGFFAYFAVLVGQLGPKMLETYFRVALIYYPAALLYFVFAFSFYAYLAGGTKSCKAFWSNVLVPMLTSLATCSSAASIPANLQATKNMGVAAEVYETVVPLGAILHKDGSVLGAIVKIAFLFGIFHMNFAGPTVLFAALIVAILVGTVMGAIPSGGMLGEMLILSLYGFPPQTLIVIAAISIIIDPIATMLNVTGDSVCAMLVARLLGARASESTASACAVAL